MGSGAAMKGGRPGYGRGIAMALLAVGFYSGMTATMKHVTADYSVFQILLFRNLFALPIILPILLAAGGISALRSRRPGVHLLRGLIIVVGHLCLIIGLGELALADVSAIQFTAPLMVTALSALILREHVGWRRWAAVLVGFAGVLIMVPPTGDVKPAVLIVLLGTSCYAMMVVATRVLAATDSVGAIAFYGMLAGALVGLIAQPWVWVTPSLADLLVLILVGLFGGLAQLTLVAALKQAPPPVLAPFDYTIMLWALGLDLVFWQATPSLRTLAGAAIIAAAGLYVAHREAGFGLIFGTAFRSLGKRDH